MTTTLLTGDNRVILPTLPERSVQCVVTSPPYYGLRSYLPDGVRLRADLSDEERRFVVSELERLGIRPITDEV